MQSTSFIPNYQQTIANSENNFALFVFGSVYKLLAKMIESKQDRFNVDGYVLLMGMTVGKVNLITLLQSNLL